MKKIFAILMIVMMVMCFMPTVAFGTTAMNPGAVNALKTVSGPDADGNYTIHLSVQGKNVVKTTGSNADVVLVVDNSGSMTSSVGIPCTATEFEETGKFDFLNAWTWETYRCKKCGAEYFRIVGNRSGKVYYTDIPAVCTGEEGKTVRIDAAKAVSKEFAKGILEGSSNKLALIGFSHEKDKGGADDSSAVKVSVDLTDSLATVNSGIDMMTAKGGTNYSAALEKAYQILDARSDKSRPGYVIFISDGAPGYSGESLNDKNWNGADQISKLKTAGISVFTVGIALDTAPANYLSNMATDKDHFINVSGTDYDTQLSEIMKLWAEQINSVPAGTNAVMVDTVDLDKFKVTGYSQGLTKQDGGRYSWNIGDITEDVQTQTIKIKPLVSGTDINTNTNVNLTYKDPNGETQIMPEEKIGDPTVDVAKVTFNVENGKWADESTGSKTVLVPLSVIGSNGTLKSSDVPIGMKANDGYESGSWDTEPNITKNGITGDVTYTYTFKERVPVKTTATVTFKVVNGTWEDNTTADIQKTITLEDGNGTLVATDVPVLMKANDGYESGSWDTEPNITKNGITGDVTYTYTFTKKEQPPIPSTHYYTVKWNNYDNTNLETDYCTYYQMPTYDSATPVRPADEEYTYEFIGWDKEVVRVTGDAIYTAQFKAVAKVQPKPEDPADPTNPEKPGKPDKPAKPEKPAKPDKPDTEVPKTGDTSADNMIINLFLLTSSALAAALLWYRKYARK